MRGADVFDQDTLLLDGGLVRDVPHRILVEHRFDAPANGRFSRAAVVRL